MLRSPRAAGSISGSVRLVGLEEPSMTRNAVRSAAVALLLSLAVLAPTPAHAADPATPVLNPGDVLQQIWSWVTSIFGGGEEGEGDKSLEGDHGCTIDPNGGNCVG